ncbi:hypothetical protein FA13DRAFT_1797672 [Coprinellus micaceus]|uniref:Uncharacterized protein n=1 Tax=Coprinellus micaceus TaxID=71717 RepID=A0A4Y7SQ28_COPMI|nr:hypothetical protein FA13DRAFT_1797672 [Coprinellus micaceus]
MSWLLSPTPRPRDYGWPDSMTDAGVLRGTDPDSYPRLSHRLLSLAIPLGLPSDIIEKRYASSLFKESIALRMRVEKVDAEARWFRQQVMGAGGHSTKSAEVLYLEKWQNIKEEELEAFKSKWDEVERSVQAVRAKDKKRLYS